MPTVLLPSSAAAFAPRSSPNVVLSTKVEPWLTVTLKRVNRVKRPLNNVIQHTRCLTEKLSSKNAIWTLCSMMCTKAPQSELEKNENQLWEALHNHQIIHIEAYVVHVDMVSRNEVAFKLTPETIESLVDFHKDVYLVDAAANTHNWSGKHGTRGWWMSCAQSLSCLVRRAQKTGGRTRCPSQRSSSRGNLSFNDAQLASPTSSYSQPFTPSPFQTYNSLPTCMPTTSAAISSLPLPAMFPSMLVQPCGTAVNIGMGGLSWGDFASPPYGTIV
ncbi:aliphatic nitrilase [Penicillium digitatum]|uniref:Aliphatic nitrilase n=1 Tax=Penicillium digitatum TaxID=36651 RepID=A0A7T7BIU4_PENDI|nr:aliphatic nitrilase [Penicillium digitatum]